MAGDDENKITKMTYGGVLLTDSKIYERFNKAMLDPDRVHEEITVDNISMGGDPAHGREKTCVIEYGKGWQVEVPEGWKIQCYWLLASIQYGHQSIEDKEIYKTFNNSLVKQLNKPGTEAITINDGSMKCHPARMPGSKSDADFRFCFGAFEFYVIGEQFSLAKLEKAWQQEADEVRQVKEQIERERARYKERRDRESRVKNEREEAMIKEAEIQELMQQRMESSDPKTLEQINRRLKELGMGRYMNLD